MSLSTTHMDIWQGIELDPNIMWSCAIRDLNSGELLWQHDASRQLKTASIGKVFLLTEVARRVDEGRLELLETVHTVEEDFVAESGILYMLSNRDLCVNDLCTLIGAFSDNMATNILLRHLGLDQVQQATKSMGFEKSGLFDFVRLSRKPDDPLTLSRGTAEELTEFVRRVDTGELHSPAIAQRVRRWLAANSDLSMVASAFYLDPLAHEEEDRGVVLWNKTGTISDARIDVGCVHSPDTGRRLGYAILSNWTLGEDWRVPALDAMCDIGRRINEYVTAK